jgi:hypothetical protein
VRAHAHIWAHRHARARARAHADANTHSDMDMDIIHTSRYLPMRVRTGGHAHMDLNALRGHTYARKCTHASARAQTGTHSVGLPPAPRAVARAGEARGTVRALAGELWTTRRGGIETRSPCTFG